jgi:hypothetical protein
LEIFFQLQCVIGIAINKKDQEYFKITKETYLIIGGVIPIARQEKRQNRDYQKKNKNK